MKQLIAFFLALLLLLSLAACSPSQREQDNKAVYEVRYELNGGSLVSGELLQRVPSGGDAVPPTVAWDGHVFKNWSGSSVWITSDRVITAQWERRFNIVFDPGDGTLSGAEAVQSLAEGEVPQAPEASLEGAEFLGWRPEPTPASKDITYTAQWKFPDPDPVYSSEEIYQFISPSVVEILVFDRDEEAFAIGSGFFIDDQGLAVTNYHVVDGAYSATATMSDGTAKDVAEIIAYNKDLDLALVRIDVSGNPCLELEQKPPVTGEVVYAMGSSLGLTGTFSDGIVSTASRTVEGVACVQTTAPISQGNSGGPLVNVHGRVLGVNSMTMTEGQNLNFAISIGELEKLERGEPMTLSDFGRMTAPAPEPVTAQTGGFYDRFDAAEMEFNDVYILADALAADGNWMAADLGKYEDVDWFEVELKTGGRVLFEAAPYYKDDLNTLLAVVAVREEDEMNYLEVLEPDPDEETYDSCYAILELEAGTYYFALTADPDVEDSEQDYPIYYAVRCRIL